ncbi:MAG: AAA family ATPase [Deltaproteobacteria bacterium]|nr:AAA family ATPase [Deltaproteobacteria bacterium]
MTTQRAWRLEGYAGDAKTAVTGAQALADERSHLEVDPIHLFYRLVDRDTYVQKVLETAGVDPGDVLVECESVLRRLTQIPNAVAFVSPRLLALAARAESEATRDATPVRVRHLLVTLSTEATGLLGAVLRSVDLDENRVRNALKTVPEPTAPTVTEVPGEGRGQGSVAGPAADADALHRFTRDMSAESSRFDRIVGRDAEIRRVMQVIARRQKNNPVLVGEPGVGKRTIARAIASRLASGGAPDLLKDTRLFQLDMGLLIAGAKLRGELEDRLRQVLVAAQNATETIVLVIDDLHTLFANQATGSGAVDLLKPALARGEIQILGTTTPDGYKKHIDSDPALSRLFAPIEVEEPTLAYATEIVRGLVESYESYHGVRIADPAVVASVKFAKRYLGERALPDPAIDLLDESAAQTRLALDTGPLELDQLDQRLLTLEGQHRALIDDEDPASNIARAAVEAELTTVRDRLATLRPMWDRQRGLLAAARVARDSVLALRAERDRAVATKDTSRASAISLTELPPSEKKLLDAEHALGQEGTLLLQPFVSEERVAQVVEQWTGIPVSKMLESENERLKQMEARLRERVVGQDQALRVIADAVQAGRVGVRDPKKPIGSFFFLGPTGVGKTELAKALAEFLFDDEAALVRLDMSEFMEKHMVARLLGSPPGYVDSEAGGMLTEAVRRRPYSVVLFDEVEKAHPDVFNVLLQVLDDGRLTDSRGRLTNFSNTVVILTSNVGALKILEASDSGADEETVKRTVLEELKKFFRPEFLNRIDNQVVFNRLSKPDLRGIVDIQLRQLQRLLRENQITIDVTADARQQLTELGYEPAFGARPLKRVIMRHVQNPLAKEIVAGVWHAGDSIRVDYRDDAFVYERA